MEILSAGLNIDCKNGLSSQPSTTPPVPTPPPPTKDPATDLYPYQRHLVDLYNNKRKLAGLNNALFRWDVALQKKAESWVNITCTLNTATYTVDQNWMMLPMKFNTAPKFLVIVLVEQIFNNSYLDATSKAVFSGESSKIYDCYNSKKF